MVQICWTQFFSAFGVVARGIGPGGSQTANEGGSRCSGAASQRLSGRSIAIIVRQDITNTHTIQGIQHTLYTCIIPLWCFNIVNIVGGEILTIPDTPTTQGYPYGVST